MENQMQIKPATRQGLKPLVGLYSESGCGKTYSALLLARGMAGKTGEVVMIDTESGRGSLYADVLEGGYKVINLEPPFSPVRYIEALTLACQSAAVVVVDSMSHEWEGMGSVCDMAAQREANSGRAGLHNWREPKLEHQKLMQWILRSPVPLICCIRAKYKTRSLKGTQEMVESGAIRRDQIGKTVILKDDHTSPIQAEDFIFEMTAHAEILQDHSIVLTKCSHPSLRDCFPNKGPIKTEHGALLAKWCASAGNPPDELTTLKKKLQGLLTIPAGKTVDKWADWLTKRSILTANQKLSDLNAEQLRDVIGKTEIALMDTPA